MDKMREHWTNTIEKISGQQVMVDTIDCVTHRMQHTNCLECKHYLLCAKLAAILTVQTEVAIYKPLDFLDQMKTKKQATILIDHILNAKSKEEIEEAI